MYLKLRRAVLIGMFIMLNGCGRPIGIFGAASTCEAVLEFLSGPFTMQIIWSTFPLSQTRILIEAHANNPKYGNTTGPRTKMMCCLSISCPHPIHVFPCMTRHAIELYCTVTMQIMTQIYPRTFHRCVLCSVQRISVLHSQYQEIQPLSLLL